ncbi:phosphatase PAP2 family protein [bacterium]|nr:phosphatase PAP2 family protein [bacterium]
MWNLVLICMIPVLLLPGRVLAKSKVETTGDFLQYAIPVAALTSTYLVHDEGARSQFYKAFAANLALTYALKGATQKTRPNGGDHSFPSGHTSAAFQNASFIHKRYGLLQSLPTYLGAVFVGYSRVDSNNHYTEDVIAGAALGIACSFFFTDRRSEYSFTPTVGRGAFGFQIEKRW